MTSKKIDWVLIEAQKMQISNKKLKHSKYFYGQSNNIVYPMSETPHMQMANIHIHNHKHNLGPK